MNTPSLRERTRGKWFGILTALGVDASYLRNKHGPCPVCGGKDRFRWDDRNGDGTFYCNHCGAGSGTDLVMKFLGLPFRDAAPRIESVIGESRSGERASPREPTETQRRAALNALWRDSGPIRSGDPVDQWFRGRLITIEVYPADLHYAPRVRYAMSAHHPAMLALVRTPDGKPATIHKTYLTADGQKAAVEEPRRFASATIPPGAAVRLATHNGTLGIAEGIETAFATMMLFGVPCWAALNAGMLEKFQPPESVTRLLIYGDNDAHQRGQQAAQTLAQRLTIKTEVHVPSQGDTDWNDVLRGARR